HPLDASAAQIIDDTRALTLDGSVQLALPALTDAAVIGAVVPPCHWVRCRLAAGPFDATPVVAGLVLNAVDVAQRIAVSRTIPIDAGAPISGAIVPGARQRLRIAMNATGTIVALTVLDGAADAPEILVLDYQAPS